ncbi:hypothetical protein [Candidatus Wolbachia massiliensis]|uniref:Uncharacterized protein n=1 Tax=Candidatus Wolbachia massiliensis TaxID=1845000 RepID=A0A7L7YM37_9RICK|nr:hypothetical protein [Candidatus Wolbachia massiliensis]QOD38310.1 hypothetical protein ID128_06095 [Candidatus Wolbachia massiliensis]
MNTSKVASSLKCSIAVFLPCVFSFASGYAFPITLAIFNAIVILMLFAKRNIMHFSPFSK